MRKVLVIGSTGYAGVECVRWFAGSAPPNAAEFDIVLVNEMGLAAIMRRERDFNFRVAFSRVKQWQAWMSGLRERLRKLLKSQGMVLAIVDNPTLAVGLKDQPPGQGWPVFVYSADWIPLPIGFNNEQGHTITVRNADFGRYMSAVRKWTFHLEIDGDTDAAVRANELADEHPDADVVVRLLPIAVNRQGLPIAAIAYYTVHERRGNRTVETALYRSGGLYLLPAPTEVSVEEALRILLEDFCGIQARAPDPPWFDEMTAPAEDDAAAELEAAQEALAEAEARVQAAFAKKEHAVEFKRLLNETGAPLEEIVRKTFAAVGLKTHDTDIADFILSNGEDALVEVKGRGSSIPTSDVSQLIKDIGNFGVREGRVIKGLLVGNAWKDERPDDRGTDEKPIFPDDAVRTARNHSIALLSTIELFNVYSAVKTGKLTADELMQRILDTSGIVKLVD